MKIVDEVAEKGKLVYYYNVSDNEMDGLCVGLWPERTERGGWLACFPEEWKEVSIAVKQWHEFRRGDIGGQQCCNCGRHVANWSAGHGLGDFLEKTLTVYKVDERIAKQVKDKNPRWHAWSDPKLQEVIAKRQKERQQDEKKAGSLTKRT